MAPWDEPSSRTCYDLKMANLRMEKEKVANKDAMEMMNHIRELFPALDDESNKRVINDLLYAVNLENDLICCTAEAPLDEEVLEEKTYEDLDEFSYVKDLDDTFD
jgi:hypothetical protein